MSALAELIDREFLASRAPRPVEYRFDPTGDGRFGKFFPTGGYNNVTPDDVMSVANKEPTVLATHFRMSDGSLVIVRRKR